MKKQYFIILVVFIIIFDGCSKKSENTSNKTDQNQTKEVAPGADKPQLPSESYTNKEYVGIGMELLRIEQFGELKIGLKASKVIELLGESEKKSKPYIWDTDRLYHQTWEYKVKGLELDLRGEKKAEPELDRITIVNPCQFKTKRNIGIGSSYAEVNDAYKKAIDTSLSTADRIVAGSEFGGLIFLLENKKVTSIYMGAAAE